MELIGGAIASNPALSGLVASGVIAAPQILEGIGSLASGFFESIGAKEPREIKIAEALGEKELKLDEKRQEAENKRLYGYDEPIMKETIKKIPTFFGPPIERTIKEAELDEKGQPKYKHHKGAIELEEEARYRALEHKLDKIGGTYQKLRQQHGDIVARSLIGSVSFDPRLQSPIAQQPLTTDLQRFYTPIEYRGMSRGVEGIQSNLLTYLQQSQLQAQAQREEQKIRETGSKEREKYKTLKQEGKRLSEMVSGLKQQEERLKVGLQTERQQKEEIMKEKEEAVQQIERITKEQTQNLRKDLKNFFTDVGKTKTKNPETFKINIFSKLDPILMKAIESEVKAKSQYGLASASEIYNYAKEHTNDPEIIKQIMNKIKNK